MTGSWWAVCGSLTLNSWRRLATLWWPHAHAVFYLLKLKNKKQKKLKNMNLVRSRLSIGNLIGSYRAWFSCMCVCVALDQHEITKWSATAVMISCCSNIFLTLTSPVFLWAGTWLAWLKGVSLDRLNVDVSTPCVVKRVVPVQVQSSHIKYLLKYFDLANPFILFYFYYYTIFLGVVNLTHPPSYYVSRSAFMVVSSYVII